MLLIETMLGCFGSRLTLHFLPRQHQVRLSPFGKYYDLPYNLRLGVSLRNQESGDVQNLLLPFCQLAGKNENYFGEVEQELTANSVTFKVRQRSSNLEATFRFTSPFYPQNEKLSTSPFFYLDYELTKSSSQYEANVIAELQNAAAQTEAYNNEVCKGIIFRADYKVIPEHWGGRFPNNMFSFNTFSAPLLFGQVVELQPDVQKAKFLFATYFDTKVLEVRGEDYRFKYTTFFQNLEEVVEYAIKEESFIRQRSKLFDSLFLEHSLGKATSDFMAFTFQSYLPNTWLAVAKEDPDNDWFSVWEGNCVFHSTVDVEYNLAWFYLAFWPQLLEKTLDEWRHYVQISPDGDFMSHDIGVLCGANAQQYPHQMEVEENCNFVLLSYALWRFTGRDEVLDKNLEIIERLIRYVLDSDTTGNGVPNRGIANTIDDASPAVQFGREQTYLGVKALSACWAAKIMLRQSGEANTELAGECQARAELINRTLNGEGWLGDHYAVILDRNTDGLINPWSGEPLPSGELEGWNAYSLYTSNGLLYLLATDPAYEQLPPADYTLIKQDLETSLEQSLIEYGCTHSSNDKSNLWVSQNLWRDIIAGQLGLDLSEMVDRYWAFEQMENSQGRGGCFIDTYGSNFLHFYPRGITSVGLWFGMSGLRLNRQTKKLSFSPVRLPLRVPLPTFADWESGLIPYVNFTWEDGKIKADFENSELLADFEVSVSLSSEVLAVKKTTN